MSGDDDRWRGQARAGQRDSSLRALMWKGREDACSSLFARATVTMDINQFLKLVRRQLNTKSILCWSHRQAEIKRAVQVKGPSGMKESKPGAFTTSPS